MHCGIATCQSTEREKKKKINKVRSLKSTLAFSDSVEFQLTKQRWSTEFNVCKKFFMQSQQSRQLSIWKIIKWFTEKHAYKFTKADWKQKQWKFRQPQLLFKWLKI